MDTTDAERVTRRTVLAVAGSAVAGSAAIGTIAGQDSTTTTASNRTATTAGTTDGETIGERTTGKESDAGSSITTRRGGTDTGVTFSLHQGERCVPLEPLSGDQPVTEMYDYGRERYSSRGTTDLQRDDASVLFLYDGPKGVSLVFVHGRLDGSDDGGSVSFDIEGLPASGQWVIRDDSYERPTRYDRWSTEGTTARVDWTWREGRADGGVYRGLDGETDLRIDPAFNEAAALYGEHYDGTVRRWQAVSGDRDDPTYTSLAMDQPVRIRAGSCAETPAGANRTGTTSANGRAIATNVTANATAATDATDATDATRASETTTATATANTTIETTTANGTTTHPSSTTTATDTPTATATSQPTTEAVTTREATATREATTDQTTTATDGPGFGVATAVAAIGSAAAYLRSRGGSD